MASHAWTGATPTDPNDTGEYEMGTYFTVSASTTLVGIRIWNPGLVNVSSADNRTATLWTANAMDGTASAVQRSIDIPDLLSAGWSEHLFSASYAAVTSQLYCVSYWVAGHVGGSGDWGVVSHGLDSAMTTGPVTLSATGGRFYVAPGGGSGTACPSSVFNNNFYGVDVLYDTAAAPSPVVPVMPTRIPA